MEADSEDMYIKFEVFKNEETKNINKICEDLLKNRFQRYEKVANEFWKYFSQDELTV